MTLFVELKKTNRKYDTIDSIDKILDLIKLNVSKLMLYIKYDINKTIVQISNISNDNKIDIITDPEYIPEKNKIIVYGLLDKYFEMELDVIKIKGPGLFECTIKSLKRATDVRKELRLKVASDQVTASHFMVSRHSIDISNFKIPTTIKVLLDQFHTENMHLCDIFKVDIFDQNNNIHEKIKKSKKILYIEDLNNPEKAIAASEDIISGKELFGDSYDDGIKKYIEKGFKSIIIAPIIYVTDSGSSYSFAYAQLISKTKLFSVEFIQELKNLLEKLVTRIKDANTLVIQTSQQINNLSKSGVQIYITDENLKKYIISSKGFLFNILFKLQAPITIYGEIKNISRDDKGNLLVGIAFAGHSSRKDEMKRYNSFLDPMIKKYKEQLLKQRKS